MDPREQLEVIMRGAAEVISREDLLAKFEKSARTGRPLRVKLGLDPSAPDIHIGHTVVLHKMRQFQDMGHEGIIVSAISRQDRRSYRAPKAKAAFRGRGASQRGHLL